MKSLLLLAVFAVILKSYRAKFEENEVFQSDEAIDDIFTKVMQNDQRPAVTLAKRNSEAKCNPNLKFPESENVTIEDEPGLVDAMGLAYNCKARPFAVQIPVPYYVITHPTTIKLYRCYGGGLTKYRHCVVKKKKKIKVQYLEHNPDTGMPVIPFPHVTMYNHTECTLECTVKESDCSPNQKYNRHHCDCKCNLTESDCQRVNKTLQNCQCVSCPVPSPCGVYREWDSASCKCVCAKSMRDMCIKHNKILDQNLCLCT